MEFRVLGPLEVRGAGGPLPIHGRHHPKLLAILLDQSNRVVPVDRLMVGLWDGVPPESARQQVQNVVAGLRRQLGAAGGRLETVGNGYRINIEPDELDLLRCKAREAEAAKFREVGRREDAVAELRAALDEWRGPAMASLEGRMVEAAARRIEEYRLALIEERIDIELELGGDPSGELRQLTAEHPLRQRFTEQLMLALHRSGRTPESLGLYAELRERLADEFGTDPGERLRDLHTAILREEAPKPIAGPAPTGQVPAVLPAGIAVFSGRREEMDTLDSLLEPGGSRLAAITGTGGAGKTTLAVQWGHRVADRFPDGQLFVNLRGFEPEGTAMTTEEAVRVLLEALGVPHRLIPADFEARLGLYRSRMADRRILVVLDNAADAAQVRPLVPGGAGNLTLVTSRNSLHGLIAAQGAQACPVRELSADEARSLLEGRIGKDRIAAEPEATERIIESCARLPLALALMGAMSVVHPQFSLEFIAGELEFEERRLDAFGHDDATTDLRAVFKCSYRGLDPMTARLFRYLGLYPGPEISAPAAASLLAITVDQARRSLQVLAYEHLLTETAPGRYVCHDLLRAYAAELLREDDRAESESAGSRMVDHFVQNGFTAYKLLVAEIDLVDIEPALPGVVHEAITDVRESIGWFGVERSVLLAMIQHAADMGREQDAWRLAWVFKEFVFREGDWHDVMTAHSIALDAARRCGDTAKRLHSLRTLAIALMHLGEYDRAHEQLELALDLWNEEVDRALLMAIHLNLGHLLGRQSRYEEALGHGLRSLEIAQAMGDERSESRARSAVGWFSAQLGAYEEALEHCELAMEILVKCDAKVGQAGNWDSIGVIRHLQGHHDLAVECFGRALELAVEIEHSALEAEALDHRGDALLDAGDIEAARLDWQRSLGILDRLGAVGVARPIREKLTKLDEAPTSPS